jgi:hypothetical protein
MEKSSTDFLELFASEKSKLVYLVSGDVHCTRWRDTPLCFALQTAESPNVMDKVDPSAIYVIGGIVDHNRLKGIAHEKALSNSKCSLPMCLPPTVTGLL